MTYIPSSKKIQSTVQTKRLIITFFHLVEFLFSLFAYLLPYHIKLQHKCQQHTLKIKKQLRFNFVIKSISTVPQIEIWNNMEITFWDCKKCEIDINLGSLSKFLYLTLKCHFLINENNQFSLNTIYNAHP